MGSGILETSAALHKIKRDFVAMAASDSALFLYRDSLHKDKKDTVSLNITM